MIDKKKIDYHPLATNQSCACRAAKAIKGFCERECDTSDEEDIDPLTVDTEMVPDLIAELFHFVELHGQNSTMVLKRAIGWFIEELAGCGHYESELLDEMTETIDKLIDKAIEKGGGFDRPPSDFDIERFKLGKQLAN